MRIHVHLDEDVVRRVDAVVAEDRGRSAFIERAVLRELEEAERWAKIWAAVGSIPDTGHEWDADPAKWVHDQRRLDPRRVG